MDSFEFNKIAGAILGTALFVMALGIISEIIFQPAHDQEPGYVIAVAETGEEGAEAAAAPEVEPIAARLQTASVEAGMNVAKKCQACHTFEQGGPAKVGPNLWGVVGGPVAHSDSFNYSDIFREKAAEGVTWTYDHLDEYLTNPRSDMPGTAMAFAGLNKPQDRADVIAYLRSLSDDPEPLPPPPEPEAETAATGDGGAEEAAAGHSDAADDEQPAASDAASAATDAEAPAADTAEPDHGEAMAEPTTSGDPADHAGGDGSAQSADEAPPASDATSGEQPDAGAGDSTSHSAEE